LSVFYIIPCGIRFVSCLTVYFVFVSETWHSATWYKNFH